MSKSPVDSLFDDLESLGLFSTERPKTPIQSLAEDFDDKEKDVAEIEYLRDSIEATAQKVHQAYHGAVDPDADRATWRECNRGICLDARHVLDPNRPRGV